MLRQYFYSLLLILLVIIGLTIYRGEYYSPNVELRAAMDIGSGTTNMKIARVDPKEGKIIQIVFEQRVPVPFQKSLELSKEGIFDESIKEKGIQALVQLKEVAEDYEVKKIVAVATAAFRQAKNASEYVEEIKEKTGIDVRVVSHAEEGVIGFEGAIARTELDPKKVIVWDIGGGSFQLTTYDDNEEIFVEKGTKASVSFKNFIIEQIQNKNIEEVHSPNPMTVAEIEQAVAHSESIAKDVDTFVKQKINREGVKVLAVGNLFYYGIRPLVGGEHEITREELRDAVMRLADKTDEEIGGGEFAEVILSNALLVLGFMNGLHIDTIYLVDINNADGAMVYPPFWEE